MGWELTSTRKIDVSVATCAPAVEINLEMDLMKMFLEVEADAGFIIMRCLGFEWNLKMDSLRAAHHAFEGN